MEFLDLTYLLFSGIFLSGIGWYPPPPLNGKSPCPKPLSGKGGYNFFLPWSIDCQTVLRGWVPLHLARVVVSIILINEVYLRHMMIILDHIWDEPWSCYVELTPPSGWWVASATPQKKSRQSCWTFKIVSAHFSDKTRINKKESIWKRRNKCQ